MQRAQDTYMPVRNSAARDKIFPNICSEFWELEGGGGRGGCVMRTLMRAMSASAGVSSLPECLVEPLPQPNGVPRSLTQRLAIQFILTVPCEILLRRCRSQCWTCSICYLREGFGSKLGRPRLAAPRHVALFLWSTSPGFSTGSIKK